MSGEHLFIDSNILVYAHDVDAGKKHTKAKAYISNLWQGTMLPSISVQVLQEFCVNLTKRGIAVDRAQDIIKNYFQWNVIVNDVPLFDAALGEMKRFKISFWDSIILAAARKAGADTIVSEDFSTSMNYNGITIFNPFQS